jgi:hypothetical protein
LLSWIKGRPNLTLILGIVAIFEAVVIVALLRFKFKSAAGTIRVFNTPDAISFQLELDRDPKELQHVDQVIFKVVTDGLNNRGVNTD